MISFGQISNMVFQFFFMFLWSKEHFREKFAKEYQPSYWILHYLQLVGCFEFVVNWGGSGVENWAGWARAGRRAGIHRYARKVTSLARKIYTSFAVIVKGGFYIRQILEGGEERKPPNRDSISPHREGVAYIWFEPRHLFQAVTTPSSDISVRFLSSINACRLFTWHNVSSTIWLFCRVLRDSECIEMQCCPPKDPLGYNQWEESRLREELLRQSMLGSNYPWGCPNRWFLGCWCCSDRCVCGKSPWVAWKGIRVRSEYRERKHHLRKLSREVRGW